MLVAMLIKRVNKITLRITLIYACANSTAFLAAVSRSSKGMILSPESLIILERVNRAGAVNSENEHVLLRLGFLRALESYNQWDGEAELPGGADDTLSNIITPHNPSKDVDENALDLGVSKQNLKRLFDGLGSSTAV